MLPWLQASQQQLSALLNAEQLAHALLLSGAEGIGKSILANYLADALLCTATDRPCGQCKSCLLRRAGNHPDLLVLDSSGNTIGVDAVRQLSQFLHGSAQQQNNKVVLLLQAEKLTEPAANALLKTLEEPPQHSFIILTTAAPATLPATVLSRCQKWPLAAQFNQQAQQWLAQKTNRAVPDFLLTYCAGAPLKALQLIETGAADHLQNGLNSLQHYIDGSLALTGCVKQLESITELTPLLGWFLHQQLLPALAGKDPARLLALHQLFSRWCRDEKQILGQNKQLALTTMLTSLKKLSR
ncbi:DNA polymerase III subunit delta' [Rheinheimera muenzenbergensis]|uniref:DNA-directed DNA polymerase n=1 Tax=Rheinheimera muenzenbergensis TaxID=1193628 RepID=A0ABU8CAC4_9GAMM